ncbi:MAG: FixH family protein [Mucilaginibacter sp.]|uniref:FixH family protein n=1 Tax=Mucilaginibacter sp. TaxID=1882438 RepID=UPI00326337E7
MDWGKRIVILLVAFTIFIGAMSVVMFRQPDEADPHYYEKGLAFDRDYNREKQVLIDHARPEIRLDHRDLNIHFTAPVTGQLYLSRPADGTMDQNFTLTADVDNNALIRLGNLKKGRWEMVLNWESYGKKYLFTQKIDLP